MNSFFFVYVIKNGCWWFFICVCVKSFTWRKCIHIFTIVFPFPKVYCVSRRLWILVLFLCSSNFCWMCVRKSDWLVNFREPFRCHTYSPCARTNSAGIDQRSVANFRHQLVSWNHGESSVSWHVDHSADSPMTRLHRRRIWNRAPHQLDSLWSCYTCLWTLSPSRHCHVYDATMCTCSVATGSNRGKRERKKKEKKKKQYTITRFEPKLLHHEMLAKSVN